MGGCRSRSGVVVVVVVVVVDLDGFGGVSMVWQWCSMFSMDRRTLV